MDTQTPEPRDAKRIEKQNTIRHAAYLCFTDRGYHATTIDDICASVGISKGSFYWYFAGKREVLLAILDAWAGEVEIALDNHFQNALH